MHNSTDCSDAFGRKISTEHLPGTPMEPDDMMDVDTTPSNTSASSRIIERRHSLATNHIVAAFSAKSSLRQSLVNSGSSESCSIPIDSALEPPTYKANTNANTNINNNNNIKSMSRNHSKVASSTALTNMMSGGGSSIQSMSKRTSITLSQKDVLEVNRKNSKQDKEGLDPESLMFRDGRRKIDMVLCYEEEDEGVMTEQEYRRRDTRRVFLENLMREGLELEVEDKSQSFDEKTYFVKIHMPWKTETRYAEVMNLKLPVKRFITISVKAWVKWSTAYGIVVVLTVSVFGVFVGIWMCFSFLE